MFLFWGEDFLLGDFLGESFGEDLGKVLGVRLLVFCFSSCFLQLLKLEKLMFPPDLALALVHSPDWAFAAWTLSWSAALLERDLFCWTCVHSASPPVLLVLLVILLVLVILVLLCILCKALDRFFGFCSQWSQHHSWHPISRPANIILGTIWIGWRKCTLKKSRPLILANQIAFPAVWLNTTLLSSTTLTSCVCFLLSLQSR
jgi:hypothetical protein